MKSMNKYLVGAIFIVTFPFFLIFKILKLIWQALTFPFRKIATSVINWSDTKIYEMYGGRKFFFYSNINRKIVEASILPLIKGKFEVYFIDKDNLTTWKEDFYLKEVVKSHFKKNKFPYLLRVNKEGYTYLSLTRGLKLRKDNKINQQQFEFQIFDFFREED